MAAIGESQAKNGSNTSFATFVSLQWMQYLNFISFHRTIFILSLNYIFLTRCDFCFFLLPTSTNSFFPELLQIQSLWCRLSSCSYRRTGDVISLSLMSPGNLDKIRIYWWRWKQLLCINSSSCDLVSFFSETGLSSHVSREVYFIYMIYMINSLSEVDRKSYRCKKWECNIDVDS